MNTKECATCLRSFQGEKRRVCCSRGCAAKFRGKTRRYARKYPKIEGLTRGQIFRKFNPEKVAQDLHRDVFKRLIVIDHLGSKCCRCGYEEDIRALELDHKNNDGYLDRKKVGRKGKIYRYYSKNLKEAEEVLQVLCSNCNKIKQIEQKEFRKSKR